MLIEVETSLTRESLGPDEHGDWAGIKHGGGGVAPRFVRTSSRIVLAVKLTVSDFMDIHKVKYYGPYQLLKGPNVAVDSCIDAVMQ